MRFFPSEPVEVLFATSNPTFEFVQKLQEFCFEAESIEDQKRLAKIYRDVRESAMVGDKRVRRVVLARSTDHLVIINVETIPVFWSEAPSQEGGI